LVKNIPSFVKNIKIRYLGGIQNGEIVSMHGQEEAQENLRQICLREEQPDKYFAYLDCFLKKGESENCLEKVKVEKEKLIECEKDKNRGLTYAKKDFELQQKYEIVGSPTLVLNGERVNEFDFGGRSAEAVKNLLCCGFLNQPAVCSTKLPKDQAATGFSESYSSGNSSSGSCE